jgi:hypothetical protein
LNASPEPGGAKTTTLFVRLRLVTVDDPVMVQVVPFVRWTLEVEVGSVWITPVRVEAFAFNVTALPAVASRRLFVPALAVVLLKLTVESFVPGQQLEPGFGDVPTLSTRSPDRLPIVKLSKVAVWLVPPVNSIALPAETIVPPPMARMDAPLPCNPTAAAPAFVVLTLSVPKTVIEPAEPLAAASLAKRPNAPAPEVVIVAAPS